MTHPYEELIERPLPDPSKAPERDPGPDQSWGLHLDEPMAAFIPHLAEVLDARCKAVRALYDDGTIDAPLLESLLITIQDKSTLLWREHCRRKHPRVRDGD